MALGIYLTALARCASGEAYGVKADRRAQLLRYARDAWDAWLTIKLWAAAAAHARKGSFSVAKGGRAKDWLIYQKLWEDGGNQGLGTVNEC